MKKRVLILCLAILSTNANAECDPENHIPEISKQMQKAMPDYVISFSSVDNHYE